MKLAGKTAIVTGGASGFGEGIVRSFVAEGARVVIMDRNAALAETVAASLDDTAWIAADVSRAADFAAAVDLAQTRFGGLDILVNNAGIGHTPRPMDEVDEDLFDRIMAVNVRSVYLGARACAPLFKAKRAGAILNVASTGGVSPRPNLTWYNASKGWGIAATRAMAIELAPFNVRVNAINPVAGDTPLLGTFMGEDTPEMRAKFLSTIPIGRFSTPQDMGNAAVFLCSDDASMITGVALNVDGGRCI
ncbi:glucose 1-dehydrogenase [Ruixingdingia sedimenti]|uniref:Glucose 1-dehydrogenase n=1 Tax=Ruixingdingia sedimenti TaxID=3073604 RepID=A0ABU1F496_9RHOB|nr:glucose 1-dehydrogenase [Xinfangfangia sp. LG-4]MDR5651463.1 glucose 1-dehydrogenase [Xinfangfangia sp. LG-4]